MRFTKLKALDSSILACRLTNVEINDDKCSSEEDNHIHVYLRIKDGIENFEDLYQVLDTETIFSKYPDGFHMIRNSKDELMMKKYNFSKIFGPKTEQVQIFNELIKPKLLKFINGHNSTLLTYGVSSSGKTYTIVGTAKEPGVIPRSLEYLFRTLPSLAELPTFKPLPYGKVLRLTEDQIIEERLLKEEILNFKWSNSARNEHVATYCTMQSRLSEVPVAKLEGDFSHLSVSVWVSFAEIYNEHIYDLLQTTKLKKEKLKLGCANGETYVKNLTLVHVKSGLEAYQVLQYGLHHLNYAKTNINSHSSRSHSIFTIWLTQTGGDSEEDFQINHFNFCDLAGAERSKKTLNVGERLRESNNINTSLLVLGRCIAAVRKAQQSSNHHIIPFRESKLTQLFQKALSGIEDICMIVNINPCRELFEETQHVLNFSAIAKDIVVNEQPLILPDRNERISQLLRRSIQLAHNDNEIEKEKERKIEDLRNELAKMVCQIEMEEMNQMRDIVVMRNHMLSEYRKKYEERMEEMEYEFLALKNRLMDEHKRRLQVAKREIMQEFGFSDESDNESDISPRSSVETIYVSSSDEDIDTKSNMIETITIVSSDDEEEEEEEIDKWRRKVSKQEDMIAEHHKTIFRLKERIDELKSRTVERSIGQEDANTQPELDKREYENGEGNYLSFKIFTN